MKMNMNYGIEMDLSNKTISELAFREVSRVTQNISKETAELSRRMTDMQKRMRELDYDKPLFY